MLFNSFIFFVFLGIVMPAYYILPGKQKKYLLLIASYFFYGYWDYRFLSLILLSTIIDFLIGKRIFSETNKHTRKQLLFVSLFANIGILATFKYFNFFTSSFTNLVNSFGGQLDYLHISIILPVGISFYTFQTLSYTIDIYRKNLEPTNSFIDFAVFVSFFPQLVAGPIERAKNLLPQIQNLKLPNKKQIEQGIVLIVTGLFRKVLIGDTAGRYVDHIFGHPEHYMSIELISALLLFSIQIYADFSGYTNIARGTAKLLGIELMKNFEQPYLSRNITEFWKRWHISLSTWLRDYLYIPLGGNRIGKYRTYINLMLTMLLGGLWHGASWNFVIWGGLHGLYLVIHKIVGRKKKSDDEISFNFHTIINIIGTYVLVLITWFFFRASNTDIIVQFLNGIFNWQTSEFAKLFISITVSFYALTFTIDLLERKNNSHTFIIKLLPKPMVYGGLAVMFIITLAFILQADPMPFVYFQF